MTKQRLLLLALLLAMAVSAHAQAGKFCAFAPYGNTDQTLAFGQTGPEYGFQAYSCPAPPLWQYFPLTRNWTWTSTCPQGGIIVQTVYIIGQDTQINVSSGIFDPNTGRQLGVFSGFGAVQFGINLPAWYTTLDHGGPCNVFVPALVQNPTVAQ